MDSYVKTFVTNRTLFFKHQTNGRCSPTENGSGFANEQYEHGSSRCLREITATMLKSRTLHVYFHLS